VSHVKEAATRRSEKAAKVEPNFSRRWCCVCKLQSEGIEPALYQLKRQIWHTCQQHNELPSRHHDPAAAVDADIAAH
jgi:hypothetical protein